MNLKSTLSKKYVNVGKHCTSYYFIYVYGPNSVYFLRIIVCSGSTVLFRLNILFGLQIIPLNLHWNALVDAKNKKSATIFYITFLVTRGPQVLSRREVSWTQQQANCSPCTLEKSNSMSDNSSRSSPWALDLAPCLPMYLHRLYLPNKLWTSRSLSLDFWLL